MANEIGRRFQSLILRCASYSSWSQKRTILRETNRRWFLKNICFTCVPHSQWRQVCNDAGNCQDDVWSRPLTLPEPEFDWSYLCNPDNTKEIAENVANRKGVGNISKVVKLREDFDKESDEGLKTRLKNEVLKAAAQIPNRSHPDVPLGDEGNARLVKTSGSKRDFSFAPKTAVEIGEGLGLLRTRNVVLTTGDRTYYFLHKLSTLEQALVRFTLQKLLKENFQLVSVPDLVHPSIIEGCGFPTTGERTQVYSLDSSLHQEACLSGTAEMPLAGYFVGDFQNEENLPQKLCAVSRCYRAETSNLLEESGIYRVHQFTKVEMFAVSADNEGQESDNMLEEFVSIQERLFSELDLHYRVLDMPSQELGSPAYRKYDIEAWMPARDMWGEISSASNCTDFQSRRLGIKYKSQGGKVKHVHTINGTACAVPRMIMAILENRQNMDGSVDIPEVLWSHMNGVEKLTDKRKELPRSIWLKKPPKQR